MFFERRACLFNILKKNLTSSTVKMILPKDKNILKYLNINSQ